jgi:hypothetical protein
MGNIGKIIVGVERERERESKNPYLTFLAPGTQKGIRQFSFLPQSPPVTYRLALAGRRHVCRRQSLQLFPAIPISRPPCRATLLRTRHITGGIL